MRPRRSPDRSPPSPSLLWIPSYQTTLHSHSFGTRQRPLLSLPLPNLPATKSTTTSSKTGPNFSLHSYLSLHLSSPSNPFERHPYPFTATSIPPAHLFSNDENTPIHVVFAGGIKTAISHSLQSTCKTSTDRPESPPSIPSTTSSHSQNGNGPTTSYIIRLPKISGKPPHGIKDIPLNGFPPFSHLTPPSLITQYT